MLQDLKLWFFYTHADKDTWVLPILSIGHYDPSVSSVLAAAE